MGSSVLPKVRAQRVICAWAAARASTSGELDDLVLFVTSPAVIIAPHLDEDAKLKLNAGQNFGEPDKLGNWSCLPKLRSAHSSCYSPAGLSVGIDPGEKFIQVVVS